MRPSADFLISFGITYGQYDCSERFLVYVDIISP